MKLLFLQTSPASCHFLPHSCKYYPQHPVLKHPSLSFRDQVSHKKITGKIIVLFILNFNFLERNWEEKKY
jgi:hypothetical protein